MHFCGTQATRAGIPWHGFHTAHGLLPCIAIHQYTSYIQDESIGQWQNDAEWPEWPEWPEWQPTHPGHPRSMSSEIWLDRALEELWCFLTTASIPSRQLSPWQEDTVLICTPSITEAQTGPLFNATCLKHLGRGIARHLSNTIQFPQVDKTNKASCKLSRSCWSPKIIHANKKWQLCAGVRCLDEWVRCAIIGRELTYSKYLCMIHAHRCNRMQS